MATMRNGLCLVLIVLACQSSVYGQQDLSIPPPGYYLGFTPYYDGEYEDALDMFRATLRGAIRSTEGRWIDSICFNTMMGECYYQMGEIGKAIEHYDAAVQLAVIHNNWMLRVQFPDVIEPSASGVRSTITWGSSKRPTALARIPDRMGTVQGQAPGANEEAIRRGGVVASRQIFPLNVKEVVRCTAVAIRRRAELMGPVSRHDPLTSQLLGALGSRPTLPNHWSQAWISCQLGLAYKSAGKLEQAASELTKSLVLAGQYDHDLTALALVELGHLAFEQGQYNLAADYYLEATFTAAAFDQYDLMQEAFQGGLLTHLVSGKQGPYTPLALAAGWAQRNSRALQAWLLLLVAENFASVGDAGQAAAQLTLARQAIGTRAMRNGRVGARFNYLSALVDFQQGNLATGGKSLAAALTFQRASSKWLLQLGVADRFYVSGAVSQRVADDLFTELLREPTSADWTTDPVETLSLVNTPHVAPLLHWFEVVMTRKDDEKAIEIADRIRRHRFYSTLPMGGRLLALRWILEAPEKMLGQQATAQRQDLLARYADYAQLAAQAAELRRQLRAIPMESDDADERRNQTKLLEQLGNVSARQELMLSNIALRREASEFVFPPLLSLKQIQAGMPDGQLLLAYLAGDRFLTAFAVDKERIASWQVESPETLSSRIGSLLKAMAVNDRKTPMELTELKNDAWRAESAELLTQLTNIRDPAVWSNYREVVIVPDGPLWYVPFETLYVGEGAQGRPLISKVPVRFVPTAALANGTGPGAGPRAVTALVAGKMFPNQDAQVTAAAAEQIGKALPGTQRLTAAPAGPSSLFAVNCDRLIVLSELDQSGRTPYGWSPMQLDQGKRGSDLESWLALPWQGPAQIVLPGFHTAAETGLKGGANGSDIFLPVCGLMASGADSILLSRWPVGGQSTFDLIREYAQELPYVSASEAWRRSILLGARNPIDAALEPRIRSEGLMDEIRGTHPFFWAGYLLVDTGVKPAAAAPP